MTTEQTTTNKKKVLVETWGCQMNVADSEKMLGMLEKENYELTEKPEEADLVLLNTCHIREKATHKVVSRLGKLRAISEKSNPDMKIAVAGCVAQAEGKKLVAKAKNIDVLLGPGKVEQLPSLLKEHKETGKPAIATGFKNQEFNEPKKDEKVNPTLSGKSEITRYVNIAQGCNNFCTFCVVPFTRGREISRTPDDIVKECEGLIKSGAKEITLLGQNVNSYGLDLVEKGELNSSEEGAFVDLLKRVSELEGLERLRFTTSNPHDFTKPVADVFATHQNLGRYIHLPVQCGNDEVLERMKRKVTVAEFYERVDWLRSVDPEMALSTDLIVGFPGETEEQFQGTLDLIEKVRFSFVFAFKYSPRKNTAAARFKEQVPDDVMSDRLRRLNELQDKITIELNKAEIGRERSVLVHYESRKEPGVFYGRTEQFRLCRISSGRDLIGSVVKVKITDANKTALVGELI